MIHILALLLSLFFTPVQAQCNGVFGTNTICGNAGGTVAPPAQFASPVYYATGYGAKCNGSTNDLAAINSAITAASATGGTVQLPPGVCIVGPTPVQLATGVILNGAGQGATTLKLLAQASDQIVKMVNVSASGVFNLTIDMGGFTNGIAAVNAFGGSHLWIEGIQIINMGQYGISMDHPTFFTVSNNIIAPSAVLNCGQTGIVVANSAASFGNITNNQLFNTDIESSGTDMLIAFNQIDGWKCGAGIVMDQNSNTDHMTVVGNVITGGQIGNDNNDATGIEHWPPNSLIANNLIHDTQGPCISVGGQNSVISGNVGYNCDQGASSSAAGIEVQNAGGALNQNGAGSIVIGNLMSNMSKFGYHENITMSGAVILGQNQFDKNTSPYSLSGITTSRFYVQMGVVTANGLPACNTTIQGARLFITDSTNTTFATSVSGGGTFKVPVTCNGSTWING